jgi:hypothetical protein
MYSYKSLLVTKSCNVPLHDSTCHTRTLPLLIDLMGSVVRLASVALPLY